MGQGPQAFAAQRAEQRRPGEEERQAAHYLQGEAEVEAQALAQHQAQPDDQQPATGPYRAGAAPRQDEQHCQVDERQTGQQHQAQAHEQPTVVLHQRVARRQQHAADQRQANQRGGHQATPARVEYPTLAIAALQMQEEQRTAQQLHGEGAEQEGTRAQAQAGEQARQAGHGPGDGGAVDGQAERCDQVEEGQAGGRQQRPAGRLPVGQRFRRRATQLPEAEQRRRTEHQRAQRRTLQQRRLTRAHAIQVGQRRTALQQQGEEPRQAALLVQAEPVDAGALDGPGGRGPARVQAERNGQGAEDHPQRQADFHQQAGASGRSMAAQHPRQDHVEEAQGQGAEGHAEVDVADHRALQAEPHQWRAEQHGGVDVVGLSRRPAQQFAALGRRLRGLQQLAAGEEQADPDVHQEEQGQERLGAGEQLRCIGAQSPGEADAEGADEADQVERPPGAEPGDGEDAGVEQGEVAEQRYMVAAAGGGQDRRGEAAERRHHRQAHGVLQHGEDRRADRHHHQQGQRRAGRDQRMQAHGGEDGQVQHRDTGALQDQAVGGAPLAQPPADAEQRHRCQRHPGVAVLHRHRHPFRGIAQEEGQADEQQHHADAQYRVAAEQPALGRGEATLDQRGFAWRRWRGGTARRWLGVRLERRLTLDGLDGFGGTRRRRRSLDGRQLDVPVQRRGNLGGRSGRRVCERLVDAGGRLGNAFGKVLRLALHAQQALVDDLGAALEAFGEFAHLLAQAIVLLRQVLQRDGLSQGQAGKAAEEGADQRFPGEAAEDQAHQHENPLHASNP